MSLARMYAVLVLLLAGLAFGGAHLWRPTAHLADTRAKVDLEQMFPKQFGEWKVDTRMPVQLISPDQQAVLNAIYNQTLSRTYVNGTGERVMLSVAYGGDQSDATRAHRPEVCYPAQGFQILRSGESQYALGSQSLRVRTLVARQGGRIEPISYWITVGERVTLSGAEQKLAQLGYSVRGVIPDGMLVRVSTIDANEAAAFQVHRQFIAQLSDGLRPEHRGQIVGTTAGT